jgi:Tfp pilus assembly protein PilO
VVDTVRTNRQKILAVITAVIITGVAVFVVVVEPQLKVHQSRLKQVQILRLKLTKMRGDVLIKDRIDDVYSEIEPLIASTGTEQQRISLFTRELNDLYSRLDVKIRLVKILPLVEEEFYTRLEVKLEMSGHIRNILRFICSVEAHANPLKIEQFGLKTRDIVDNVEASFLITKVVAKTAM